MSGGYGIEGLDAFDAFGRELDSVAANVRRTGELVNDMVADPGLWGIALGQVIGAAASKFCADAHDTFVTYGEAIDRHKDKLIEARNSYEEQEQAVVDSITRYQL